MCHVWQSPLLQALGCIRHGCTSKDFGRLRWDSGSHDEILANRRRLASLNQFDLSQAAMPRQIHGHAVKVVTPAQAGAGLLPGHAPVPDCDGLITPCQDFTLVVHTADCVPLLFVDPVNGVVAAAHAGWKSTRGNIAGVVVASLARQFGSRPGDVRVAMGPCIHACHYEVSRAPDRRAEQFERLFPGQAVVRRDAAGGVYLDLVEANRLQCRAAGVPAAQIEACADCTWERRDRWASYRGGDEDCDHQIWSFIAWRGL